MIAGFLQKRDLGTLPIDALFRIVFKTRLKGVFEAVPAIKCTELYADTIDDYIDLVGAKAEELICPKIQGDYLNQTDADELLLM